MKSNTIAEKNKERLQSCGWKAKKARFLLFDVISGEENQICFVQASYVSISASSWFVVASCFKAFIEMTQHHHQLAINTNNFEAKHKTRRISFTRFLKSRINTTAPIKMSAIKVSQQLQKHSAVDNDFRDKFGNMNNLAN